jgi:formylglycine-generating enzyme required for sulfatase activity
MFAGGLLGLAILAGVIFKMQTGDGTLVVEVDQADAVVQVLNGEGEIEIKAKEHQQAWAKRLGVPVEIANSIGMKLVLVPPGEFLMGSSQELVAEELKAHDADRWYEQHLPGEGPQHPVRITRPFWLGATDVTQEEYQRVTGANPSEFSATGRHKDQVRGQDTKQFPVEHVSWNDAVDFCRKLSELPEEKASGRTYCLPSKAQWEYACRAGNTGRWCFSAEPDPLPAAVEEKTLREYAWFGGNARGATHPAGRKRANAWGLLDMYGNVWQWCQDRYDARYYANSPADDATGPAAGSDRVDRGGGWFDAAGHCRSACRDHCGPATRDGNLGFRVCLLSADKQDGPSGASSDLYCLTIRQLTQVAHDHILVAADFRPPAVDLHLRHLDPIPVAQTRHDGSLDGLAVVQQVAAGFVARHHHHLSRQHPNVLSLHDHLGRDVHPRTQTVALLAG